MPRFVLPYPVVPGKSDADVKAAAGTFRQRSSEYRESRKRAGITLERAYLMKPPTGAVVVAYVESTKPFVETIGAIAGSSLEIDRWFADFVKRVHGVDLTKPPAGPPPETVAEWTDPQVTTRKKGMAFTAPLRPGKIDAGRAFAKEAFVARAAELTASRRAIKESVEVVTIMSTPMGDLASVYLEGDDPAAANRAFAASQSPYDRWFKDECKKIFAPEIDFDQPVPPVEGFFDSRELTA